ncbi:ABC transporter permease [Geobacter sp. DSM 9736]|uniref:ABC transporter permease n=1 Tax=Geobacter sp. DSM 9736 TaxID=1277350 RepID=UPI000B4FEE0B|nr:ABC transporter permease [Geobacter sp. DSM 9736]SNB45513.1 putative ABC transport system permease protein [Geobacter sp. DSM 9736]
MFFRMLRQSFFRGWRRKALATATIVLSASLITALMNISIDVGDKMSREMKSYGANINVVPKSEAIPLEIGGVDYNPLKDRVFINEADLPKIKEIFWHNNIVGFAPFLKTGVMIVGQEKKRVNMIGTWFDRQVPINGDNEYRTGIKLVSPYWQVQGEWPDEQRAQENQVLVGALLARDLNLKVGDRMTARTSDTSGEEKFTVTGILTTGGAEENALVAPLATVQRLAGLAGKVQSVSVSALTVPEDRLSRKARYSSDSLDSAEYDIWYCTAYVSSISLQIEEAIPNVTSRPIWQVAAGEGAVVNKIQLLMIVVTIAAFIASGLGISSLMVTTIMERAREIGLMKALGAANWEVYLLFLSESAVVGVVGGLLGCIAGAGLSQLIGLSIFSSTVAFSPIVVPVNIVISVLIALSGSLMPSRLITKLYPAEVLHGRR